MKLSKRGFLGAMIAAAAAPAIVKASSLMPIYVPKTTILTLWGDGVHDDTRAMQALLSGGLVKSSSGVLLGGDATSLRIPSGHFKVNEGLRILRSNVELSGSAIIFTHPVEQMIACERGSRNNVISFNIFYKQRSAHGSMHLANDSPKPNAPFRKTAHGTYWGVLA